MIFQARVNRTGHEIFGAHYDEGRITRTTDLDPVWTHLSKKSQARYRELESRSGMAGQYESFRCIHIDSHYF